MQASPCQKSLIAYICTYLKITAMESYLVTMTTVWMMYYCWLHKPMKLGMWKNTKLECHIGLAAICVQYVPRAVLVKQTSFSCSIPEVKNCNEVSLEAYDTSANTTRFASPKSSKSVEEIENQWFQKEPGKILNRQREHGMAGQSIAWRRCHQRNWKRDMNWTQSLYLWK